MVDLGQKGKQCLPFFILQPSWGGEPSPYFERAAESFLARRFSSSDIVCLNSSLGGRVYFKRHT